jgi:hypothetical protein
VLSVLVAVFAVDISPFVSSLSIIFSSFDS